MSQLIFAETGLSELSCDINKVQSKDWSEDLLGSQQDNYQEIFPVWLSKAKSGDPKYQFYVAKAYSLGNGVEVDQNEALFWYKKSSDNDYPAAKNNLALMYEYGQAVEQDPNQAFRLVCDAAIQGVLISQYNMGRYYQYGTIGNPNGELALTWYEKAIENGNIDAVYQTGLMFYKGKIVDKNLDLAPKLIKLAADFGHPSAAHDMGTLYFKGEDVDINIEKSIDWFKKGSELGVPQSSFVLYSIFSDRSSDYYDFDSALRYLKLSANNGYGNASDELGVIYAIGIGVKKDLVESSKWYFKGANQGNASSQANIAFAYMNGVGIDKDYKKALYWSKKSIDNGSEYGKLVFAEIYKKGYGVKKNHKKALNLFLDTFNSSEEKYIKNIAALNIADLYNFGQGVSNDQEKAFEWYLRSAELGNTPAQTQVGFMFQNAEGIEQDYIKAFEWYKKASKKGNVMAIRNLGTLYQNGYGVEQDLERAIDLFVKAANLGSGAAMYNLAITYEKGMGVQRDERKAFEWYLKSAKAGYAFSYAKTGTSYMEGNGIDIDLEKAAFWLYKDYKNNPESLYKLELAKIYFYNKDLTDISNVSRPFVFDELLPSLSALELAVIAGDLRFKKDNIKDAAILYEMAANKGDASSMTALGGLYGTHRKIGIIRDDKRAEYWFEKAIEHGDIQAIAHLGGMYLFEEDSLGAKNKLFNPEKGFELLKEAHEKGVVWNIGSLAYAYEEGIGTKKNKKMSIDLLKYKMNHKSTSSNQKDDLLFQIFEIQLKHNLFTDDIISKALLRMEELANSGNSERQVELATIYLNKDFPKNDIEKAIFWLEKAANKNIGANVQLSGIYMGFDSPSYFNFNKAISYNLKAVELLDSRSADDYESYKYNLDEQVYIYQAAAYFYQAKGMNELSESLIRKASNIHLGTNSKKFDSDRKIIISSMSTDPENLKEVYLGIINNVDSKIFDRFRAMNGLSTIYNKEGEKQKSVDFLINNIDKVSGYDRLTEENLDLTGLIMLEISLRYLDQWDSDEAERFFNKYKKTDKKYPKLLQPLFNRMEKSMSNHVGGYIDLLNGNYDSAYKKLKKGSSYYLSTLGEVQSSYLVSATKPMNIFMQNKRFDYVYELAKPLIEAYKNNFNNRLEKGIKITDVEKQSVKNILSEFIYSSEKTNKALPNLGFETMQLSAGLTASDALVKSIYKRQIKQSAAVLLDKLDNLNLKKQSIMKRKLSYVGSDDNYVLNINNKLSLIDKETGLIKKKIVQQGANSNDINLFVSSGQDVIDALHKEDALLTMLISNKRSFVWLVTSNGIYRHHVSSGSNVIKADVEKLLYSLDPNKKGSSKFPLESSSRLYDLLIRPFEQELKGINRLVISPDSVLSGIPFSILNDTQSTNTSRKLNYINPSSVRGIVGTHTNISTFNANENNWLINRFAISVVPSIYSYIESAKLSNTGPDSKDSFIGIGNPVLTGTTGQVSKNQLITHVNTRGSISKFVSEMSPLPETEKELSLIAKAFSRSDLIFGENATEKKLQAIDLSQYGVISFATHALVSNEIEGIVEPSLILTPVDEDNPNNDGLLTASEISRLNLDADIVLLSACNTASSFGKSNSQGLSGLANSFFNAGARSLLVSYWSVISDSAVDITTRIFKPSNEGRSYAHKHRNAVLDLLQNSKDAYKLHPSYWAPFSVIGVN